MSTPSLPLWAQPHDLAVVVEFARMTQAMLEASVSRSYPTSVDVVEFVGALAADFEQRYLDVVWGEDGAPDFLEATELAFEQAAKPGWWPTEAERARRTDIEYLITLARRLGAEEVLVAQGLDDEAVAQAEREDAVCDAAGKRIAAALVEAGIGCTDYGDGIVTVDGWIEGRELRLCAGWEDPSRGVLVEVISTVIEDDEEEGYTTIATGMPAADTAALVELVRHLVGGVA